MNMTPELESCYRILELQPGASLDEAKEAYRTLAKVWQPDRFVGDAAMMAKAQEKLRQLKVAYETICMADIGDFRQGGASPPPVIFSASQPPGQPNPPGRLRRHGCLTTCLIFILLVEGCGIITGSIHSAPGGSSTPSALAGMGSLFSPPPEWYTHCVQILSLLDIVCVIFIFMRKKWAFFGSVGVAAGVLLVSIFAGRVFDGVSAFVLPAILYGVLQIGGENSGWKQLR
jgi:hypothetical protein